jgi:hypothetical protein
MMQRVFLTAWSDTTHDGIKIPKGKFYLPDVGYACRPRIVPFRSTRYNLNEFHTKTAPKTPRNFAIPDNQALE